MSEHFNPQLTEYSTWKVYSFIGCLKSRQFHPPLIPENGITLSELKFIAHLITIWFRSMDSKARGRPAPLDSLVMGKHLYRLLTLLQDPSLKEFWQLDPRTMTFRFFFALRHLFNLL